MGTLVFIMAFYVLFMAILAITFFILRITKVLGNVKKRICEMSHYNRCIRFLMEAYFEIALSIGVNIKMIDYSRGKYLVGGVWPSNIMAAIFFVIVVSLPVFIAFFYLRAND